MNDDQNNFCFILDDAYFFNLIIVCGFSCSLLLHLSYDVINDSSEPLKQIFLKVCDYRATPSRLKIKGDLRL